MNQEVKEILQAIYAQHELKEVGLNYQIIENYKHDFNRLSQLNNSCLFIVDLHKFEYVFTSDNFKNLFGFIPTADKNSAIDETFLDSKIHPDDFFEYKRILPKVGEFLLQQPKEERVYYKHIFELRIQNIQKEHIKVSWERQALETDEVGNLWLMLGVVHVLSPEKDFPQVRNFFINTKTGERIPFELPNETQPLLTSREKEVLKLIQKGLLSKEIAGKLSISVNTVNNHRQNILQKMQVNNSLEAVDQARKSGII